MKKNLLALSVAAAALVASSVATAAVSDTWYLGVRGGYAHMDWNESNDINNVYTDSDTAGYGLGLFGGYSVNPYFSVEGGYNFFDAFKVYNYNDQNDEDFRVHGPELSLRVSVPLSDAGTDLFLRGGVMYAFADHSSDKVVPVVGAGVNFALDTNWALRLGYDRYFSVYDETDETRGIDFDMDYAYLSLAYVFGTSAPAPQPEPVTQTVTTSYTLDANTTFGFDSVELSPEGRDAISQVVVDAKNANMEFVRYDIKGYTDRLGKAEYNQKLSERRAQAVAAELQSKGVPANIITVTGMGAADPVTGADCEGLSRKDAIKCLAPDRRVVVNVTGSTTKTETIQ